MHLTRKQIKVKDERIHKKKQINRGNLFYLQIQVAAKYKAF